MTHVPTPGFCSKYVCTKLPEPPFTPIGPALAHLQWLNVLLITTAFVVLGVLAVVLVVRQIRRRRPIQRFDGQQGTPLVNTSGENSSSSQSGHVTPVDIIFEAQRVQNEPPMIEPARIETNLMEIPEFEIQASSTFVSLLPDLEPHLVKIFYNSNEPDLYSSALLLQKCQVNFFIFTYMYNSSFQALHDLGAILSKTEVNPTLETGRMQVS